MRTGCHTQVRGDAAEGDVRLVDDMMISNWVTGRLEVFLDGSWGQVCARGFGAPDAHVACRQLGYGAGTVLPRLMAGEDRDEVSTIITMQVFPDVTIIDSGCTGAESRLVDCGPDMVDENDYDYEYGRPDGCHLSAFHLGLRVGCVRTPENGAA